MGIDSDYYKEKNKKQLTKLRMLEAKLPPYVTSYLDDKEFIRQMAGCMAYASTAGFESICEAMYLGKPLMMVPSHIEQKCNAFDATKFDAAIESDKFDLSVLLNFSQNGFVPDAGFPQWALSAGDIIIRELEELVAGQ